MTGARKPATYTPGGEAEAEPRARGRGRGRAGGRGWWSGSRQRPAGARACRGEPSDIWMGEVDMCRVLLENGRYRASISSGVYTSIVVLK